MGEFEESLSLALGAGKLFDPSTKSEYIETMVSKSIDKYIEQRRAQRESPKAGVTIDPRLEDILHRMIARCYELKEYQQVIGVALEAFRLDIVEAAILKGNQSDLLDYVFQANQKTSVHLDFRNEVFRFLVKLYRNLPTPDYIAISQCLVHVNDPVETAQLLKTLISGNELLLLTAYQIAFDVEENATQEFIFKVLASLPTPPPAEEVTPTGDKPNKDENAMETDEKAPLIKKPELSPFDKALAKTRTILSGDLSIKLTVQFLSRNNHADLLILKQTKVFIRFASHWNAIELFLLARESLTTIELLC